MGVRSPSAALRYPASPDHARTAAVREHPASEAPKPKLLDRVRQRIRARHYSRRTEQAYVHWIKRYIFFHDKRHPADMGAGEVTGFLTAWFGPNGPSTCPSS